MLELASNFALVSIALMLACFILPVKRKITIIAMSILCILCALASVNLHLIGTYVFGG